MALSQSLAICAKTGQRQRASRPSKAHLGAREVLLIDFAAQGSERSLINQAGALGPLQELGTELDRGLDGTSAKRWTPYRDRTSARMVHSVMLSSTRSIGAYERPSRRLMDALPLRNG